LRESTVGSLKSIDHETLKSKVTRGLRQAILSGKLKPGQRLAEVEISRWLGVSRSPIRDALAILEQEGLVSREEGRVAHVVILGEEDIRDIYGFRLALELYVLSRVIEKANEEELSVLQSLVDQMAECVNDNNHSELIEHDLTFHETLFRIAGNQRLLNAWQSQIAQLSMLIAFSETLEYDHHKTPSEHQKVLLAIYLRDVTTAQSILEEHICTSRDRLLLHISHVEE
jgi:DNA-binding GntR family transcriptional regulator